jgi:hypothetical protein
MDRSVIPPSALDKPPAVAMAIVQAYTSKEVCTWTSTLLPATNEP